LIPTIYGVIVLVVGGYLMTRPTVWMLSFFIITTLFGGASAIDLPALGGSSVQPSMLVLVLLGLRIVLSRPMSLSGIGDSIRVNLMLVLYCVYGAITAFLLPKIFFHEIELAPMGAAYLGPQPLAFSSQNITTAFYLIGTGFAAVAASLIAKDPRSPSIMVNTFIFVTWAHVFTGIADLGLNAIHLGGLLNIFRNGHYAQLNQVVMSVHRISGIMPEPSNYSSYGIVLLAIMGELWIRGVASRTAGPAALAMLIMLILTTSTTAYAGVGIYALTLVARIALVPAARGSRKALIVGGLMFASLGAALGVMMFSPASAQKAIDIVRFATVAKANSESGEQRASWARAGFEAFATTHGFGVGVGSFRSSGLVAAVLGSTGLAGGVLLAVYLFQVIKPFQTSSYRVRVSSPLCFGAAASWAILMSIVSSALSSASPDPGAVFGVIAGLAIVWRSAKAPMDGSSFGVEISPV
jgi:hypothetical protein